MKTLRLPLKKKWFEMTKNLIKGEEYRLPTPYWYSRLCLYDGKEQSKKFWEFAPLNTFSFDTSKVTFKHFDTTTLTLGYPSNSDKERIIEFEQLSISIGYGKEEWGAEPNKLYFVIKHGERVEECSICGKKDIELSECEICGKLYCENCGATYNQFTQIDFPCCKSCEDRDE